MLKAGSNFATIAVSLCIFLPACGGDSRGAYRAPAEEAPGVISELTGNAGDEAASLGWKAPRTGTGPLSYDIAIEPAAPGARIVKSDTRALITGLSNGTSYTFSVSAKNRSGTSNAVALALQPSAAPTRFEALDSDTLAGTSGMLEPALLNNASTLWLAYSSANYRSQSGLTVRDISTRLASSNDGGATFGTPVTLNAAADALITGAAVSPCFAACSGRWVYRAPFLIDDASDPDATRRFKLFALKHFIHPATSASLPELGAIVMRTAASPAGTWSDERAVLSWNTSPRELSPQNNVQDLDTVLSECTALIHGSGAHFDGKLDFVFACPNAAGTQKIVLLRSRDHADSFEYIATPLHADDAATFNAQYFTAPALLANGSTAPVLIATPVIERTLSGVSGITRANSGCEVFPFANRETGTLFRNAGAPVSILRIPYRDNYANGDCTWDRGAAALGILLNEEDPAAAAPFSVLDSAKKL